MNEFLDIPDPVTIEYTLNIPYNEAQGFEKLAEALTEGLYELSDVYTSSFSRGKHLYMPIF